VAQDLQTAVLGCHAPHEAFRRIVTRGSREDTHPSPAAPRQRLGMRASLPFPGPWGNAKRAGTRQAHRPIP
jgi:hypothetical protein